MTGVGKVLALGPGQGTEHHIGLDRFVTKGNSSQRPLAFSVIEYEGAPRISGPPPHVHRACEEAWFILEGKVRFTSASRRIVAGKGTYLYVPRGVPHTFQVEGARPARWVGISPPVGYVGLVEELGSLIPAAGPPDVAALRRLFAKYDTELLPPLA